MRRVLAAIVFGLVLLIVAPAALADDYPPEPVTSGVSQRAAAPAPAVDLEEAEDSLAGTGFDGIVKLGVGAGLILVGSTALLVGRRRRSTVRS
jgi:hypothetical protein